MSSQQKAGISACRTIRLANTEADYHLFLTATLKSVLQRARRTFAEKHGKLLRRRKKKKQQIPDLFFRDVSMIGQNGSECSPELKVMASLPPFPMIFYSTPRKRTLANNCLHLQAPSYINQGDFTEPNSELTFFLKQFRESHLASATKDVFVRILNRHKK